MSVKKSFKLICVCLVIFFMMTGAYALVGKVIKLSIFTISNVEVKGVSNADRKELVTISNRLIGMNIFDTRIKEMMQSKDPWVQKLVAERIMPNSINLVVFEEVPLFAFKTDENKCFVYTQGKRRLGVDCDGVRVTLNGELNAERAEEFAEIYKNNTFLRNYDIILKEYNFAVTIDGVKLLCPYDGKIFADNYEIYTKTLKPIYRYVEYADLTVMKRIFVKGDKYGSSQG